jgi:hypothetical protein
VTFHPEQSAYIAENAGVAGLKPDSSITPQSPAIRWLKIAMSRSEPADRIFVKVSILMNFRYFSRKPINIIQ